MRISYNSPVILTFTFVAIAVYVLTHMLSAPLLSCFVTMPQFNFANPLDYFRLFSHVLGHQNLEHLVGNFTIILLLGPILEEKYTGKVILYLMLLTAFITAVLNALLFNSALLGASGIVFLFILLASFTTFKSGEVPLTFILVFCIFIGQEAYKSFENDHISQFAHILGGIIGSVFGFKYNKNKA